MRMAISYRRISREENTLSLADQSREIQAYAKLNGLEIHTDLHDEVSGYAELLRHENLIRTLNICAATGIIDIIVTDLSRLTRSVRDGILLLDWLHRAGIKLHLSRSGREVSELDYLTVIGELAEAERYYLMFLQKDATEVRPGDPIRGKAPLGYVRDPLRKKVLIRADIPAFDIQDIFEQALGIRKQRPRYSLQEISRQIDSNAGRAKKICDILGNPLYTGRKAPRGTKGLEELRLYRKIHEAYVSEEDFVLINGGKVKEGLDFRDLLFCKNCYEKHPGKNPATELSQFRLHINCNNLQCRKCGKSISIPKLKAQLQRMCQGYIFEPDALLEFRMDHILVLAQLDELLKQITKTGNLCGSGRVLNPNFPKGSGNIAHIQSKLRAANNNLIKTIKKSMNMNSHYIGLHYHIYQGSDDNGRAIRDLLDKCFDGVFVVFIDNRATRVEPVKVKPGVKRDPNPFGIEQVRSDLAKADQLIKIQAKTIRSLLAGNPFLTDFLSMRIIDHNFNQWDAFSEYVTAYKAHDPLAPLP